MAAILEASLVDGRLRKLHSWAFQPTVSQGFMAHAELSDLELSLIRLDFPMPQSSSAVTMIVACLGLGPDQMSACDGMPNLPSPEDCINSAVTPRSSLSSIIPFCLLIKMPNAEMSSWSGCDSKL